MKICHIATEASPIAKVGGLADVTMGLSRELQKRGHEVCLILPKYSCLKTEFIENLHYIEKNVLTMFGQKWHSNNIWSGKLLGIQIFFIECASPMRFFERSSIYGFKDDLSRFCYFSLAALNFISQFHNNVDIIHVHDWHTSIVPALYQEHFKDQFSCRECFI